MDLKQLYIETELHPEEPLVWERFAQAFKTLVFKKFDPLLKRAFVLCLDQPIGNHQDLALAGISLLKLTPYPSIHDPLLLGLLKRVLLPDPETERWITAERRRVLLEGQRPSDFIEALTAQCALNESVYAISREENDALAGLASDDPLRACYEPPKMAIPLEDIPQLTPIREETSHKVQQQYEEHPYPRWTTLTPSEEGAPDLNIPRILIAGCGTGQHAFRAALQYPESEIIAFDLSRASIAYALQKQKELGISNISFYQADLLELDSWQERFDLIECVGVLHHLQDPMRGWSLLRKLLRPSGWMEIGLYSAIGRRDVVAARRLIAEKGWTATLEGIRDCRQALMDLPDDHPAKGVTATIDFYTVSTCRDLLFHVQEMHFTLPQIEEMLKKLQLNFVRFELRDKTLEGPREGSLADWHAFEQAHPQTFSGMYQFWVR